MRLRGYRLGGWTRLWIVISVSWMALWMVFDIASAQSSVGYWVGKVGIGLIPPLLLYGFGWTVRWIVRGFGG